MSGLIRLAAREAPPLATLTPAQPEKQTAHRSALWLALAGGAPVHPFESLRPLPPPLLPPPLLVRRVVRYVVPRSPAGRAAVRGERRGEQSRVDEAPLPRLNGAPRAELCSHPARARRRCARRGEPLAALPWAAHAHVVPSHRRRRRRRQRTQQRTRRRRPPRPPLTVSCPPPPRPSAARRASGACRHAPSQARGPIRPACWRGLRTMHLPLRRRWGLMM